MKKIVIIGADVSGMNIFSIISDVNKGEKQWDIIGYFDEYKSEETLFNVPIFSSLNEILSLFSGEKYYIISAIGNPGNRRRLMQKAENKGFVAATIIHPTACISEYAQIGKGSMICQFASVHPYATIGAYGYVHTSTVIGPRVTIGESVTINSLCAVSAKTTIGDHCYIGVGVKIIQGITIGEKTTVAAGSVVIQDLPNRSLAAGVPAKVKKENYGD